MDAQEYLRIEEKVRELEKKIHHLRTGRRVLMNLLEHSTQERLRQIVRLEKEIQALKKRNLRYAMELFHLRTTDKPNQKED
jgi:predicted  nucleic acid-binding Zn-ribbon protein